MKTMNTKEAIEWLDPKTYIEELNEVIDLLKRGEKYKKIVDEVEEFLEPGVIFEIPPGMTGSRHIDIIKYTFNKIKQKYFPKPEKKKVIK